MKPYPISPIEYLARKYDPTWEDPQIFDPRPTPAPFKPTGDLRADILTILRTKRYDNLVEIGLVLGASRCKVSQYVQGFVREGLFTWEQIYEVLPKVKEAHERGTRYRSRRDRYYQRQTQTNKDKESTRP